MKKKPKTTMSAVDESGTKDIPWRQFSPYTMRKAFIRRCSINSHTFLIDLSDSRTLQVSTTNLGPVCDAGWREKRKFRVVDDGSAVTWPELGYTVTLRELMGID